MGKSLKVAPVDLTRIAARNGGKFHSCRSKRSSPGKYRCQELTGLAKCRCGARSSQRCVGIKTQGECGYTASRSISKRFKPGDPAWALGKFRRVNLQKNGRRDGAWIWSSL